MIGLDTNVLVRYIMQDDALQAIRANKLIDALTIDIPGFVSLITIIELNWVLSSAYGLSRPQIAEVFDALLRTKEMLVDRADIVARALRVFRTSTADFADCLIEKAGAAAGCRQTMTFDVRAAKSAGMTLIV